MRPLGIAILASFTVTACSLPPFPTEGTTGTGGAGTAGTSNSATISTGTAGTTGTGGTTGAAATSGSGPAGAGTAGATGIAGITGAAGTTGTSNGGATGTAATTGGVTTACTPVPRSTGGIACPAEMCAAGTYGGRNFSYGDGRASSICMMPESLCAAGVTGAQDSPNYLVWGAGFGFCLSPDSTPTNRVEVQLAGWGVSVAVSSLPTGADLLVEVIPGTVSYCAKMTATTQTLAWTSFNTHCWDNSGVTMAGAPNTAEIRFWALPGPTAGTFDFCVTSLSFQ